MNELHDWLPIVFVGVMGLAMFLYVILDGYDLGVGILLPWAEETEKDMMIASIGPFWDANETWLVLGVGILLTVFPMAHGIILTALYFPVAIMLLGLILRGVAFDFRAKAHDKHRRRWNLAFNLGSVIASFAQGFMLGQYIVGFSYQLSGILFSVLIGCCLLAGYTLIGACWLIMKAEGVLQQRAVSWARSALWFTALGVLAVSIATPLVSPRIFEKWFSFPNIFLLAPIPVITVGLFVGLAILLKSLPRPDDRWCWLPFMGTVGINLLCFYGMAYSFFPYIIPDKLTIWQAAGAHESLMFIFIGAVIVLPAILSYTFFSYRVFRGKVRELSYG
jgi:cytochrome d ubiquinol oxidase subunit II